MPTNSEARQLIKDYFQRNGKTPLPETDALLEKLATLPTAEFKSTPFPARELLNGCYFMGCDRTQYIETTDPGLPLELFSDFTHSFVFCLTGCAKDDIDRGDNTIRNYTLAQKREINHRELCPNLPKNAGVEPDFYISWSIYRRNDGINPDFGPKFISILSMNGDFMGNFGVIFDIPGYKPFGITMPNFYIDWSKMTFGQCNHRPPTREVVRYQFVPFVSKLADSLIAHGRCKPEFLFTLHPFVLEDDDEYGAKALIQTITSAYPTKALDIPANLCRKGTTETYTLYQARH